MVLSSYSPGRLLGETLFVFEYEDAGPADDNTLDMRVILILLTVISSYS